MIKVANYWLFDRVQWSKLLIVHFFNSYESEIAKYNVLSTGNTAIMSASVAIMMTVVQNCWLVPIEGGSGPWLKFFGGLNLELFQFSFITAHISKPEHLQSTWV